MLSTSFVSLAPVILGLHWGIEMEEARERAAEAKRREELEYLACLRGEGCPADYEAYREEHVAATQVFEEKKRLRLAGASQSLLKPILRTVVRRALPATMQQADDESNAVAEEDEPSTAAASAAAASASLDEKMAKWDATEDEQRASTLGGNLPLVGMPGMPGRMTRTDQPKKMDAFDVGMNLSGLILFPLAILICSVPFWIGNIDVSSVGPPPMS